MRKHFYELTTVIDSAIFHNPEYARKYLSLALEQMNARAARHLETSDFKNFRVDTVIRPWPRDTGENAANGYDKLRPRTSIEISLLAFDLSLEPMFRPPAHYLQQTAH